MRGTFVAAALAKLSLQTKCTVRLLSLTDNAFGRFLLLFSSNYLARIRDEFSRFWRFSGDAGNNPDESGPIICFLHVDEH